MAGIEYGLGYFDDLRLQKGGPVCMPRWWPGRVHVSADWRGHAPREIQFTRFLRNGSVTATEMATHAGERTAARAAGRDVVVIQDTSELALGGRRAKASGYGPVGKGGALRGLLLHAVLAVDAGTGGVLGLVDAKVWNREGGKKVADRRSRKTSNKESQRWLDGTMRAGEVLAAAAQITGVSDRESDIYEHFAQRPDNVHLIVRACQNRRIETDDADQMNLLFSHVDGLPEQGRFQLKIPAAPGRKARTTELAVRFTRVVLRKPLHGAAANLPATIALTMVDVRETSTPQDGKPIRWRLPDHAPGHKPRRGPQDHRSLSDALDDRRVLPHTQDGRLRYRGSRHWRPKGHDQVCRRSHDSRRHCNATRQSARRHHRSRPRRRVRSSRPADPGSSIGAARRQDRTAKEPAPQRLARLCELGHRPSRRLDRILRKTRPTNNAPGSRRLPAHRAWHHAEAPKCVNEQPLRGRRGEERNYVLLPAAVATGNTSFAARSGVSSFQRTDPNGRSSMRRTRTGSGPR